AWMDRLPASDSDVERYLQMHVFAAWEYGHDGWQLGPSDFIRLNLSLKAIERMVNLGEGEDWEVSRRAGDYVHIKPLPEFLRRRRGGQPAARPLTKPARTEIIYTGEREVSVGSHDEAPKFVYVDETRLAELRQVSASSFDLRKLTSLCEELNICYRSQCYHAVAALNRAVMDHVPPLL